MRTFGLSLAPNCARAVSTMVQSPQWPSGRQCSTSSVSDDFVARLLIGKNDGGAVSGLQDGCRTAFGKDNPLRFDRIVVRWTFDMLKARFSFTFGTWRRHIITSGVAPVNRCSEGSYRTDRSSAAGGRG